MVQMNAMLLPFPLHKIILLICMMLSCCHDILYTVGLFTLTLFSPLKFNFVVILLPGQKLVNICLFSKLYI